MTSDLYTQVHDEYLRLAKNPAWHMAFTIALGEWMQDIATYHQGPIQAIADRAVIRQLDAKRDDITKRFLLSRLEEIRKEKEFDPTKHPRDKEGQFARKGTGPGPQKPGIGRRQETPGWTPNYADAIRSDASRNRATVIDARTQEMLRTGKIPSRSAQDFLGVTANPVKLDTAENPGDAKAEALRAQAAMTYALQEKTLKSGDKQRIQYTITGPNGSRVETPSGFTMPDDIDWEAGERIQYMVPVGPDNPATVAGKVMDIGLVAGLDSDRAAKAGSVVADIHDTMNSTSWGRRLNNVANVARVVTNNSPIAIQAQAVAGLVELLGPDAARAFGPKMRQLSYRYTGQEALPSQFSQVAAGGRQKDSKDQLETTEAFERRLMLDLAKDLPTDTQYKAALQAGSTPPSKGYLLDKNGKVVSESVGFADDWYTPFNLKRLPKLQHGSYVRTRGYGGITPEDIQLALHTGAQRVTVVSNSGVFSIEFDNRARQMGHRFGFGGNSMQRRYTKSLDAMKNNKVTGADGNPVMLNTHGYATALRDLKVKYPYFVSKVSISEPINQQVVGPGKTPPGTPDRGRVDAGYVRPLSIRAGGARAGLADDDIQGAHQSYDQLEAYQLRKAQFGEVRRRNGATGSGATTGDAAKPASVAGTQFSSPAEQRRAFEQARLREAERNGQGTSVSSYAKGEPISADEAGQQLAVLKKVVQNDVKAEAEDAEVQKLIEVLASEDKGADYRVLRTKYATDESFRSRVINDLGDVYGEHAAAVPLLAELANRKAEAVVAGTSDADPDAPDDMEPLDPEEEYNEDSNIPKAVMDHSLAIQDWKRRKHIEAAGNPLAAKRLEAFNWYQDVSERDLRAGNKEGRNNLPPDLRAAYDGMHREIAGLINAERAGQWDAADYADEAPPSQPRPAKKPEDNETAMRANYERVKEIVASADRNEAYAYGRTIIDDVLGDEDEPEVVIGQLIRTFDDYEAQLRQKGMAEQADLMDAATTGMRDMALNVMEMEY